jgi:hypothetical protein
MRLVSFDVGIKNMAYCIFDLPEPRDETAKIKISDLSIVSWNTINLMNAEPEDAKNYTCTCCITNPILNKKNKKTTTSKKNTKNTISVDIREPGQINPPNVLENPTNPEKKTSDKICGKKAKYHSPNGYSFFCEKHAKTSTFRIPTKESSPVFIKKAKIGQLRIVAESNRIDVNSTDLKPQLVETISQYFREHNLVPVVKKQPMKANFIDLISIGKNMKKELDGIQVLENATHVIIENQISPIANRMKTIQGMLAQYFIMRSTTENPIHIEFVSAAGKLKGFEKQNENMDSEYAQHKRDAVFYCLRFMEMENFFAWKDALTVKKKDDLADCFLQGIWYLQREKV